MLFLLKNPCQPYSRLTCAVLSFEPLQYYDETSLII